MKKMSIAGGNIRKYATVVAMIICCTHVQLTVTD